MAVYEVEWSETVTRKVRIHAPANDELMHKTPERTVIGWCVSDVVNESAVAIGPVESEVAIKSISRVEDVPDPIDPNFPDVQTFHEEVRPL